MPITTEICEDGYLLLVRYFTPATLEEMIEATTNGRAYRDSVPHIVHTLFDFQHCDALPASGLKARYSPVFTHPRSGKIVIFAANFPIRRTMTMMAELSMSKDRLHFFDDF